MAESTNLLNLLIARAGLCGRGQHRKDDDQQDTEKSKALPSDVWEAAASYAWEYFKYHAQQRMIVFRFYLLVVGATLAGYGATYSSSRADPIRWAFGAMLLLTSFLFWRLDVRSYQLVKIAEVYLKENEGRLSKLINSPSIQLLQKAEEKKSHKFPIFLFQSFRQIYLYIFLLVGIIGIGLTYVELNSEARGDSICLPDLSFF